MSPSLDARAIVDYSLARRATLTELASGRDPQPRSATPSPTCVRAARYHGEPARETCPVCERESLACVSYTFGDCFRGEVNGRARTPRELLALSRELPEFCVFVVEVCSECRWNHLLSVVRAGHGGAGVTSRPFSFLTILIPTVIGAGFDTAAARGNASVSASSRAAVHDGWRRFLPSGRQMLWGVGGVRVRRRPRRASPMPPRPSPRQQLRHAAVDDLLTTTARPSGAVR